MGILLSWSNLAEASTTNLAVSSEAAGLGLRAVLTPQISDIWRSSAWGATTINLDVDLGNAQGIGLVAIAAPRDGLLPGPAAQLWLGASLMAPPNTANLQASSTSIVPGGGSFGIGANTNDLGAVSDPAGGNGARRLGSIAAGGGNVYLGRTSALNLAASTPYEFSLYARSNASVPSRGTLMTVDEFSGANWTGTLTRSVGTALVGSGIDGTWRSFTRRLITRADTQSIQVYWAEGWQTGAEIEVYGFSISRRPEIIDSASQALGTSMASFGLWAWVSSTPVTTRYLRLSFTGAANDAYLQLGRLWVGPALVTTRQASYGFSIGASDPGSNARAPLTGVRDVQRGRPYRTLAFTGDTLTTAEAAQVEQAALAAGSTGQVFAARLHTDPARTGCFGVFSRAPTLTRVANALWRADFSLEEDL